MKEIILEAGTENASIYKQAFYGCTALKEIVIPGNYTYIGQSVFHNCTALKNVYLEEGVQVIERRAFIGCKSLERMDFPSTITRIGSVEDDENAGDDVDYSSDYGYKDVLR